MVKFPRWMSKEEQEQRLRLASGPIPTIVQEKKRTARVELESRTLSLNTQRLDAIEPALELVISAGEKAAPAAALEALEAKHTAELAELAAKLEARELEALELAERMTTLLEELALNTAASEERLGAELEALEKRTTAKIGGVKSQFAKLKTRLSSPRRSGGPDART